MKNVIFIGVLLFCVTTTLYAENYSPLGDHGGYNYSKIERGFYNNRVEDFKNDLWYVDSTGTETDMFQYKEWVNDFVGNVQRMYGDNSITLEDILENSEAGDAPEGFGYNKNSSYVMARWDANHENIKWGARDAEDGERFLWFTYKGVRKCILSLTCANFMFPVEKPKKVKPRSRPRPEEGKYEDDVVGKSPEDRDINITITNENINENFNENSRPGSSNLESGDPSFQRIETSYDPNALDWLNFGLDAYNTFAFQGNGNFVGGGAIAYPRSRCFPQQRIRRQRGGGFQRCAQPIRRRSCWNNGGGNNGGGNPRQYNNAPLNPPGQTPIVRGPRRYNNSQASGVVASNFGGSGARQVNTRNRSASNNGNTARQVNTRNGGYNTGRL